MTRDRTFVIVGAGLAGGKAAETLRVEGFDERVVLIGDEQQRPYERPPLSKDYLRGELERDKLYVHSERFYAEHDIELRRGRTAVNLDASINELVLDDGERLRYDRLLLATGAEPRRLSIPGADLDGVLYLRSVEDSDALRARLERGGAVVVIGAGWIGTEVAASARQRGLDVTVINPHTVPLEPVLGVEVGSVYRDLHTDHGVRMLPGTSVVAFEGERVVERVRTADGRALECDFVVVAVGVQPRVRVAADAGLMVDNGIRVDERLHSTAPGVFAAGDVANAHHRFYGEPIRVEHWANALHQGPVAARNMLGDSEAVRPAAVLLLRSVRHRHGVRRPRPQLGSRRVPRRSRHPRVHRVLDGPGSRRGRHELQRLGRHRRHPAAHPPARRGRRPAARRSGAPARGARPRARTGDSMNRLRALHDAGVSIWLDTLSRELLESGEFARLIADCAVTGATSNPTIFAAAITGSDRYDDQLRAAVASGVRDAARAVLRARARRRRPRRRPAARRLRGQRRARRLRVLRVHARPRRRPRGHDRAGARPLEPPRPAQRDDQGPGHRRPGSRRSKSSPRAA